MVPTAELPICLPIAEKPNATCTDDIQCTTSLGKGSGCIGGYCKCKEIYQFKNSINKCVRDMSKFKTKIRYRYQVVFVSVLIFLILRKGSIVRWLLITGKRKKYS